MDSPLLTAPAANDRFGLIVTVNDLLAVIELASVTKAVKVNGEPVVVLGVPANVPLLARVVPVGVEPLLTLHVKGSVPPVAAKV